MGFNPLVSGANVSAAIHHLEEESVRWACFNPLVSGANVSAGLALIKETLKHRSFNPLVSGANVSAVADALAAHSPMPMFQSPRERGKRFG